MTLTLILTDHGHTVERHTDIGADVLTLLPKARDEHGRTPRQALHERRQAGLDNAWKRRPTPAMRKRMADAGKPVGIVEQSQADAMAADPVNVHATARYCTRIMSDAEALHVERSDPYPGEVLKACHAFAAWYAARAATHVHDGMAHQLAAIGTAYRIAASILWDRMLRAARGLPTDDRPKARVVVSPYVSTRHVPWCGTCEAYTWCGHE